MRTVRYSRVQRQQISGRASHSAFLKCISGNGKQPSRRRTNNIPGKIHDSRPFAAANYVSTGRYR